MNNPNKYVASYVIIQFRPCSVTEEFVNIGVALACDSADYFDYRLIGAEGIDRISNFFINYDMCKYTSGLVNLNEELQALREENTVSKKSDIIKHLARPLEATFKCNKNIGAIVISNSPEQTLNDLFRRHIVNNFKRK